MLGNGIFDFSGVPGSGKTSTCVYLAIKHYKKENSPFRRMLALFKYKLVKNRYFCSFQRYFNKYNFINILKNKYNLYFLTHKSRLDILLFKVSKLFFKFCYFFFLVFCIIYLFLSRNLFLIFLFICFLFRKNIYKSFDSLDWEYYNIFPKRCINNVYSSFPILLDKKNNIYSHKTSIWQWNNEFSYLPNSVLISDEIQLFIDSDEYSDKKLNKILKRISHFLQAHRHFDIKNIYLTAQSPDRVFKKAREICNGYVKLHNIIKFPFIPIGIIRGTIYYDLEFYGRFIPKNREERSKLPFDYKKFTRFVNLKSLYSSYDSKYLAQLNYSKPLSDNGDFDTLRSNFTDLKDIFKRPMVSDDFNDDIFDVDVEIVKPKINDFFKK